MNPTGSFTTGLPFASVTFAVTDVLDAPSATIEGDPRLTLTCAAGPAICVSTAWAETFGTAESDTVIVGVPATLELVTVAL